MAKKCEQLVSKGPIIENPMHLWQQICTEIIPLTNKAAVDRWFKPLQVIRVETSSLILGGDNLFAQSFIEDNFRSQLHSAVGKVFGKPMKVEFMSMESAQAPEENPVSAPQPTAITISEAQSDVEPVGLNTRFTFETFVVGANSEFAHAASLAVAQAPARTFNPLFLHGSVGLGKTHLMQAIGHQLQQRKKGFKVLYVTSEQFVNEYISATQKNELTKFRRRYRQVDALLIDDIQFLCGKERSQEEFFHTFNSIVVEGHKQMVLASDVPPSELNGLEKRLVSRFEWGNTVQLSPPDVETRIAILRHKLASMKMELPDEVLFFIAEKIRSNIRRLEGALTRVASYGSLVGKKLTVTQIETLLKDLLKIESQGRVTFESIQKKVAETYDLRPADMTSKRRPANIAMPRMIAMHLCRRLTPSSLKEIGDAFGGRDHGTVIHADKTVREKMAQDSQFRMQIEYLSEKLSTEGR